jgi:hypothetical protein
MGQEASVPLDHDFDEQARAPPSTVNPNPTSTANRTGAGSIPNLQRAFNAAASAAAASRPLSSKGMFQSSTQNDYEPRDSPQAVGSTQQQNAHFYDPPAFEHQQLVEENVLLSQGSRLSPGMAHDSSNHEFHHPKSPPRGIPDGEGDAISNHSVSVGTLPEKSGSKRGLFSTPGRSLAHSRGAALIHSMRNITLGKALGGKGSTQTSKQQLDWEKQWDEDDDSEDEPSDEAALNAASALDVVHAGSIGPPDGFILTSAIVSGQQSLEAQQLAPPTATLGEPSFPPEPEEQLSDSPIGNADDDGKPNVEMFLPMLRVLGKGSFGKVRCGVICTTLLTDSD